MLVKPRGSRVKSRNPSNIRGYGFSPATPPVMSGGPEGCGIPGKVIAQRKREEALPTPTEGWWHIKWYYIAGDVMFESATGCWAGQLEQTARRARLEVGAFQFRIKRPGVGAVNLKPFHWEGSRAFALPEDRTEETG